jgi:hypothetical protein
MGQLRLVVNGADVPPILRDGCKRHLSIATQRKSEVNTMSQVVVVHVRVTAVLHCTLSPPPPPNTHTHAHTQTHTQAHTEMTTS